MCLSVLRLAIYMPQLLMQVCSVFGVLRSRCLTNLATCVMKTTIVQIVLTCRQCDTSCLMTVKAGGFLVDGLLWNGNRQRFT